MSILFLIVGFLVLLVIIAAGWLLWSVGHYREYWQRRATVSGQMVYVALGDSAAQGIGATSPNRGYVGQVAKRLEAQSGKSVQVINLSKTGAKMADYLTEQAPKLQKLHPDIVTIEIGANDIAVFNAKTFRAQFKQVLTTLPDGTYVANMPLFNSRPKLTPKAKEASVIIEQELQTYPKLHFVNLEKQTSEHQSIFGFAPDFFHPNNLGYKNWTNAFWLEISKAE